MRKRYDLEIKLGYGFKTEYRKLLKSREWVRGTQIDMKVEVTNNSPNVFPGAKVNATLKEYGNSIGLGSLSWGPVEEIIIPKLGPGESITLPLMRFTPLVEGLCEVSVEVQAPADSEVWVTGWRQTKPEQNTFCGYYAIVGWQELEIIKLLSK